MEQIRKPFQGVFNIIRFNWHFYVIAFGMLGLLWLCIPYLAEELRIYAYIVFALVMGSTLVSLLVSCYVYDFSDLYSLAWLDGVISREGDTMVNIHAGFDETSVLLDHKFKEWTLQVFDFYNPSTHTEVSIKRARKAYPPYPDTEVVSTGHLPLGDESVDKIFAILAAHEVREEVERVVFFKEMKRILKPSGEIIVTEHLRDTANFLAYNIGFLHFHSKPTWLRTFEQAGLRVSKEIKVSPFISTFILVKHGITS